MNRQKTAIKKHKINEADVCVVADLRFFDFSPELIKLLRRQTTVLVVVEPLDEVQRPVLGELEFRLQDSNCRLEADELFTTSHTTTHQHCALSSLGSGDR